MIVCHSSQIPVSFRVHNKVPTYILVNNLLLDFARTVCAVDLMFYRLYKTTRVGKVWKYYCSVPARYITTKHAAACRTKPTVASNVSLVWCVCICQSVTRLRPVKRLNGSKSCLGWRLTLGAKKHCIRRGFRYPTEKGDSMWPSPNYFGHMLHFAATVRQDWDTLKWKCTWKAEVQSDVTGHQSLLVCCCMQYRYDWWRNTQVFYSRWCQAHRTRCHVLACYTSQTRDYYLAAGRR